MINLDGEFGSRVARRLQQEAVIWLTTVSPNGTPQPNPVWFYWDGESCLIYSKPDSVKLRNIAHNPKVSLNLEGATVDGGDVIVLTGEALVDSHAPPPPEAYRDKYHKTVQEFGTNWDQLHEAYSVAIHVEPIRFRGF
jgi:PPOX class probable F420-dependent enzyme